MNDLSRRSLIGRDAEPSVESVAAQLTDAAYAVVLQHRSREDWLDLELDLWNALSEAVKQWDRDWPHAGVMLVDPSLSSKVSI